MKEALCSSVHPVGILSGKIFCVGLHKTGTSSLASALSSAGLRVADYFGVHDPSISQNALAQAVEIMRDFDAAQDSPWFLLYKELDSIFPGSKFILTTRSSSEWFASCLKHFGGTTSEIRKWLYGNGFDDPIGREARWIAVKEKHEENVRKYFSGRPESFLELNISSGDGWEKLGPFLGINNQGPFPKVNTAAQRQFHRLYLHYQEARGARRLFYRMRMKLLRQYGL
jgi:hypothetical protein